MFKIRLVSDWREGHKWLSIQLIGVAVALQAAVTAYPAIADWLPSMVKQGIAFFLLGAIALGRLIDQGKKEPCDAPPQH